MAHAYFFVGTGEEGKRQIDFFAKKTFKFSPGHPDYLYLSYGLFPVEEARRIGEIVSRAPLQGSEKLIVISVERIFHEAQNALLKTIEEPAPGTAIILIVPHEGVIIPTLRSRLLPLPGTEGSKQKAVSNTAEEFLRAGKVGREKIIAKILTQAKSDNDEEKQGARKEARELMEGILIVAHTKGNDYALLRDLSHLLPVLHERAAPLKPILEHILLVVPQSLKTP